MPPDANIEIVHMKSRAQPFYAFEPGTRIQVLGGTPRRGIYSFFPHVNHWPVAMIPSDGRTCLVPDRTASFSPCIASPPVHEDDDNRSHTGWLWGTCVGTVGDVLPFARASARPPDVIARGEALRVIDRAYTLDGPYPVDIEIRGSAASPLVRPAFVAKRWGAGPPRVKLGGSELAPGRDYRFGHVRTLDGDDLVVWLNETLDRTDRLRLG